MGVQGKYVRSKLNELDNFIEYELPDDKNIKNRYYKIYNKALALFSEGKFIEAGKVLGIEWCEVSKDSTFKKLVNQESLCLI